MNGLFGDLFDFDRNGDLDSFEQAAEMQFLHTMMSEEQDDEITELQNSGLAPEKLEFMDGEERRQALEDAGLDPDEYDF